MTLVKICPNCREVYMSDTTHDCTLKGEFKWAGTVSHGTLRPEDLIPKLSEVLQNIDPAAHAKWALSAHSGDDQQVHVVELMDLLDERAPEGYYFGTIEGDGSDFGFWSSDDEPWDGTLMMKGDE